MISSSMDELKHSFSDHVKPRLLANSCRNGQAKAMLNEKGTKARLALAARLREAISVIGSKTKVAEACDVTDQAITGWVKTGKIAKDHLPVIAGLSGFSLNYLLTGEGPMYAVDVDAIEGEFSVVHAKRTRPFLGPILAEGEAMAKPLRWDVPVASFDSAGNRIMQDDKNRMPSHRPVSAEAFAFLLNDASLMPEFAKGFYAIVEPAIPVTTGNFALVRFGGRGSPVVRKLIEVGDLFVWESGVHWIERHRQKTDADELIGKVIGWWKDQE